MNAFITLEARRPLSPIFLPWVQQAVRLLQLSSIEYTQALREAAQLNPFLELEDAAPDGPEPPSTEAADATEPLSDPLDSAGAIDATIAFDRLTAAPARAQHLTHDKSSNLMQRVALPGSLRAHLHGQISLLRLNPHEAALARAVIEALDGYGYLRISFGEIAAASGEAGSDVELELTTALCRVQALEPAGIGARGVQECLQPQLDGVHDAAMGVLGGAIVEDHIALLASHDLARVVCAALVNVQRSAEEIRRLGPRPSWHYSNPTGARAIVADVTVRRARGAWCKPLNAGAVPRLRINRAFAELTEKQRGAPSTNLRPYLEQARWLVGSVTQRTSTIHDVARTIVAREKTFLEHGSMAIKPLGLREIADQVGGHPSTVSRSVHDKSLFTLSGVFELQHFFSRGMRHDSVSASAPLVLREPIRELIAGEVGTMPRSDATLVRQLKQQAFRIARRTVTKYRQTLHIDPVEVRRLKASHGPAA